MAGGQDPSLASWLPGLCSQRHNLWKSKVPYWASAQHAHGNDSLQESILKGKQGTKWEKDQDGGWMILTVGNGLLLTNTVWWLPEGRGMGE